MLSLMGLQDGAVPISVCFLRLSTSRGIQILTKYDLNIPIEYDPLQVENDEFLNGRQKIQTKSIHMITIDTIGIVPINIVFI